MCPFSHQLTEARDIYKKRYALARKQMALPTNTLFAGQPATNLSQKGAKITFFGETPVGSRGIFATIAGYRYVCSLSFSLSLSLYISLSLRRFESSSSGMWCVVSR